MKIQLTTLAIALAAVFPMGQAAHAQSTAELKAEIEALKQQLQVLMKKVDAVSEASAAATANAAPAVEVGEFNRIKVKTESIEDNIEASGLKGFKVSGMIDPTFMYSNRQDHAGFVFLNNFDGRNPAESFAFDNSYFGMAVLDIQKETEGGNKWRLTLAPHKSAASGYNINSIVHEASVSIPLTDPATRLIAGMIPDWSGYEYIMPNQQPLITHNMLFDFTIPTIYNGVGMEFTRGQWITKFMLGNVNEIRKGSGDKTPALTYRADYAKGEFSGFGFAGTHSFSTGNKYDMFEVDGYFTRGDLTLQGQLGAGRKPLASATGGTAQWWGLSALAGYKLTPRLQAVARLDYIANRSNGGGVFGSVSSGCLDATGADDSASGCANSVVSLGDYRNGFGPTPQDAFDYATGVTSSLRGVNRYALSTGFNYLVNPSTTWKMELRFDGASGPVFLNVKDGSYKKSNTLLGSSVVVSF
jgi:hypothetical protein